VVWYSRTGRTHEIGQALARALGAASERLEDPTPREGGLGYARCSRDALTGRLPPIAAPRHDPADYALVIVGTPVWNASISAPVRAYLARVRSRLPQVAFFLSHGGFAGARVLASMEALAGQRPAATLAVKARHFARGEVDARVRGFVATLGRFGSLGPLGSDASLTSDACE
jgi:hypothetical protein